MGSEMDQVPDGSRRRSVARWAVRTAAPHGLVALVERRRESAQRDVSAAAERQLAAAREARLAALGDRVHKGPIPYSYDAAIDLLVRSGVPEAQVIEGSMPVASLRVVRDEITATVDGSGPALALHVGNFVGVSLAAVTAAMVESHPDSRVISVDPALPHRGIDQPQRHVLDLLTTFGLQANSLVVTGYSDRRNPRDDGLDWTDATDPQLPSPEVAAQWASSDASCEKVLSNLAALLPGRFDVVLLDGNHDGPYLRSELGIVETLLRPGGFVAVDDVVEGIWSGIAEVFSTASGPDGAFEQVGYDGRVGILRLANRPPK